MKEKEKRWAHRPLVLRLPAGSPSPPPRLAFFVSCPVREEQVRFRPVGADKVPEQVLCIAVDMSRQRGKVRVRRKGWEEK